MEGSERDTQPGEGRREQADEHATPDQMTAAQALRHREVAGAREGEPGGPGVPTVVGTDAVLDEHDSRREHELVERRAELLPEEESAGGSADPEAQAARILEDSALRTEVPGSAPTTHLERRTSAETTTPSAEQGD